MVGRILRALFFHYIKQKAKLISKKQGNFLHTMFSQNHLTTESPDTTIATSLTGTSEKIIMEKTIEPVEYVRQWSIDRIHHLAEGETMDGYFDAIAIAEEFDEWLNLPEGPNYLQCLVIEREPGFGDQEIDIIDK